jgi:hypothetical protein
LISNTAHKQQNENPPNNKGIKAIFSVLINVTIPATKENPSNITIKIDNEFQCADLENNNSDTEPATIRIHPILITIFFI